MHTEILIGHGDPVQWLDKSLQHVCGLGPEKGAELSFLCAFSLLVAGGGLAVTVTAPHPERDQMTLLESVLKLRKMKV